MRIYVYMYVYISAPLLTVSVVLNFVNRFNLSIVLFVVWAYPAAAAQTESGWGIISETCLSSIRYSALL